MCKEKAKLMLQPGQYKMECRREAVIPDDVMPDKHSLKEALYVKARMQEGSTSLGGQREVKEDIVCSEAGFEVNPEEQSQTPIWTKICRVLVQRRGIFWALAFATLGPFISLIIKFLSGRVSPNEIVTYRSLTLVLFTGPNLIRHRDSLSYRLPWKAWAILIIRAIVGTACTNSAFYAYQLQDMSTVKCIMQSSSLVTCVFACLCLKENCSIPISLSCCISVVGVVLVVQPTFIFKNLGVQSHSDNTVYGLLAAFSAAAFMSLTYITLRALGRYKIHAHLVTFSYGSIGFLGCASLTMALNDWSIPRCGLDRLLVLAICLMGYLQITFITLALQTENAAVVAIISAWGVFVIFVLDYTFFDVTPNVWKIIGAVCITASSVGASISSYYAAKRRKLSKT